VRVADLLAGGSLAPALAAGLCYRTGPFVVRLQARLPDLADLFGAFYAASECYPDEPLIDFNVRVVRHGWARRLWRPQVQFFIDGVAPFEPFPGEQAFPLLEWGLNWCIAMRAHQFLMLHAAVVERGGRALLLPAMPGSGKSTLCTALAFRGWRLLSDEFGLVDPATRAITPLPRAIPLKNASIEVIRAFAPDAFLGPVFRKTRKGDVAHVRPPGDSLARQDEVAPPALIVFPRFIRNSAPRLATLPESLAFTRLSYNAFNYRLLGASGFLCLAALVKSCRCLSLEYGDLDSAVGLLDGLVQADLGMPV
jgi:HprK-related kinase A